MESSDSLARSESIRSLEQVLLGISVFFVSLHKTTENKKNIVNTWPPAVKPASSWGVAYSSNLSRSTRPIGSVRWTFITYEYFLVVIVDFSVSCFISYTSIEMCPFCWSLPCPEFCTIKPCLLLLKCLQATSIIVDRNINFIFLVRYWTAIRE